MVWEATISVVSQLYSDAYLYMVREGQQGSLRGSQYSECWKARQLMFEMITLGLTLGWRGGSAVCGSCFGFRDDDIPAYGPDGRGSAAPIKHVNRLLR